MKCPFYIVAEGAMDWSHFTFIHGKSHRIFKVFKQTSDRLVIFYKARIMYPFPFYNNYVIVRKNLPDQFGYEQIYYDIKSAKTHYLKAVTINNGETSSIIGDFLFDVSPVWKVVPGLFFKIFKLRMRRVMNEDNIYMRERLLNGQKSNPACEFKIPDEYDFLDDFKSRNPMGTEFDFCDHTVTDLLK